MCPGPLLAVADGGSIRVGPRQEPYLQQRVVNDFVYKEKPLISIILLQGQEPMFFSVFFYITCRFTNYKIHTAVRINTATIWSLSENNKHNIYIVAWRVRPALLLVQKKKPATYYYRVGERRRKERGSRTGNRARQKTPSDRTRFGLWVDMMDET